MDFGNMLGLNVFGQSFVHFGVGIVIALISRIYLLCIGNADPW